MKVELTALEILEIAEQIERNGVRFYSKAAELFKGHGLAKMFLELSNWEAEHEKVFKEMRKQIFPDSIPLSSFAESTEASRDSRQEIQQQQSFSSNVTPFNPKMMAGLAVFGIKPDPASELTGKESIVDILKIAIEKEKDSIIYYTGLKDFVPAKLDKDKIDDIIKEELRHIRILRQSLEQRE
jgi:rubrerythrin